MRAAGLCYVPCLLVLVAVPSPAHAYLDPGTGSLLLQGALAAIATVGFAAKLHWYRIKAWFRGEEYPPPSVPEDSADGSSD